jgi:hypothetical protein
MGGATIAIIVVLCLGVTLVIVLASLGAFGGGEPTAVPTDTATPLPTDTPPLPTDTLPPPTDTPIPPTSTPAPTMTPTDGLLLDENFNNPDSGWEVDDSADGDVGYRDGYYYVLAEGESIQIFGRGPSNFSDLVIDVYSTQISAPSSNINAYGVMCRLQSDGDGYLLRISGDGQFAIQRVVDGSFEYLVEWTDSDVINQGNVANHIQAVCDGPRLALYANGTLLAEGEDDTFTKGDIALTATTFGSVATEIHFDNLIVVEPDSVLVRDDFGDTGSGWDVESFDGGSLGYQDGIYFIQAADSDYYYVGQAYVSLSDVAIEVDATQIFGPSNDNNYYGSGCRLQSDGAGYLFLISGQGYYAIYREGGESEGEFLVDWTESDVIRQGNATNHLRAVCDGTRLAIAINGEFLEEVVDFTYTTGDVFLVASTLEDEPTEVHFDDFFAYAP